MDEVHAGWLLPHRSPPDRFESTMRDGVVNKEPELYEDQVADQVPCHAADGRRSVSHFRVGGRRGSHTLQGHDAIGKRSCWAVPPRPDANNAAGQAANAGKITPAGKAEIIGGFVLLGTGVLTVAVTAVLTGTKFSGPKAPALYAGGAAAAGVGVTLIVFGSHRHAKN